MATYQQKIGISVDQKQVSKLIVNLKFIEKKIRKLNQTSLNLGRVRTRSRNIRGTGRNTATGERKIPTDKDGNVLVSKGVERSITALNKANKALNKYVQDLSKADGAQRGFAGSTNKISTQVSALRDRLKGLTRSNSEYRSTLQAVQRGEQALFQDRNKRLRDQANSLGRRGEKGGTGDLVTSLLNEDVTQSIDGLNNYVSRLNALRDTVKINSTAFEQLSQKIVQVNEALEKTQFKKPKKEPKPQKTRSNANQIKAIEEQRANILQRINDSSLGIIKKNELKNNLNRIGVGIQKEELALAKQINNETQRNLVASEKRQRRRQRIGQSALIGGGFPLLFGGGITQAIPGFIGGALGEAASPGGGFAGSIAATALASSATQFANSAREVGNALKDPTEGLQKLRDAGFQVSESTQKQIEALIEVGRKSEALDLVQKEFAKTIGLIGINNLKELDSSFDALDEAVAKLVLKLQADVVPVAVTLIKLATKFVNSLDGVRIRKKADELDPKAFSKLFLIKLRNSAQTDPNSNLFGHGEPMIVTDNQ